MQISDNDNPKRSAKVSERDKSNYLVICGHSNLQVLSRNILGALTRKVANLKLTFKLVI